jgi:hypothetical protein
MNMINFPTLKSIIIEENNKFIEEQGLFEKKFIYTYDFLHVFLFNLSFFSCFLISCAFCFYKCFDGGFVFVIKIERHM